MAGWKQAIQPTQSLTVVSYIAMLLMVRHLKGVSGTDLASNWQREDTTSVQLHIGAELPGARLRTECAGLCDRSKTWCDVISWDQTTRACTGYTQALSQGSIPSGVSHVYTTDRAQYRCGEDGWIYVDGKCYFFSVSSATWEEAQTDCTNRGGATLARIRSAIVNKFLVKQLDRKGLNILFFAANDRVSEDVWRWGDSTEAVGYVSWYNPAGPDDFNNADCAVLRPGGTWDDVECSNQYNYICEKGV